MFDVAEVDAALKRVADREPFRRNEECQYTKGAKPWCLVAQVFTELAFGTPSVTDPTWLLPDGTPLGFTVNADEERLAVWFTQRALNRLVNAQTLADHNEPWGLVADRYVRA